MRGDRDEGVRGEEVRRERGRGEERGAEDATSACSGPPEIKRCGGPKPPRLRPGGGQSAKAGWRPGAGSHHSDRGRSSLGKALA